MSTLNKTLAEFQQAFESGAAPYHVKPEMVEVMHRFDDELRATGILERATSAGDAFPAFELPNQNGDAVSLALLLKKGPVVVSFFRGQWCPYCNFELQALQQALPEIEAAGATLVAISPQSESFNQQTIAQHKLGFDILSDNGNAFADELGVAYRLGDELIEKVYKGFGLALAKYNGDDSWRLPLSSRFVIGTDGKVVQADVDVNYRRRPEPSDTVAVLQGLLATA